MSCFAPDFARRERPPRPHSGSRDIGKELAEHHIGEARKLPHNQGLVDRDLAVFVPDTPQVVWVKG